MFVLENRDNIDVDTVEKVALVFQPNQYSTYGVFAFISAIILLSEAITPKWLQNKGIIIECITNRTILHINFSVLGEYWVSYHQKRFIKLKVSIFVHS